ncbi:hypothetical protein M409DRAFT_17301 [Zasmidium cellare ATCC 36951]|uniref:Uncharacterized protein n=1 Tax=Zasmidium cellare ATCC 36951 TaxID=1080233 RepID=A0A6A6D1U4_ZASCE|nr:uncharacterized protein M409DRAFT_17301 [Zasmidium cellare ATCC 36951]KAF2172059.1 hypothetical protein M409DRAFT_17301 [Zasmidium cellare ATCC 36951]
MATTPTAEQHNREKKLLRKLMKARIACGNSLEELETLNGLTDDWDATEEVLENAALDIHLQCEYGCKESSALHDILSGLLTGLNTPGLWTEVEVRQENAVAAAKEIIKVIDGLLVAGPNPSLGLKEMKRRAQHITTELEALEETFAELESEVQACIADAQKHSTSNPSS